MKSLLSIVLLIFAFSMAKVALGNSVRIEGHEPDYAGFNIVFQNYTDPVSKNTDTTFILKIGPQGRILTETNLQKPIFCFADFDIYRLKLIIVPGDSLRIKLPPRKPKSFEESKNPFFKPIELWLYSQSENTSHLNSLIGKYDQKFYSLNDRYFNQLYYGRQAAYLDSVRLPLEKEFGNEKDKVFIAHKQLMLKSIESGIIREGREKLMSEFESLNPSLWFLPSFSELLERLFYQTMTTESNRPQGNLLKSWVAGKKINELRDWTVKFTGIQGQLADLILLKMMHDAFYSGQFQQKAILDMFRNELFTNHKTEEIKRSAKEITKKLEFLLPGTKAPEICLPLISSGTYCSNGSEKPMQYILFADLEIPVCQEQVKYLKTLYEKIGTRADIFLVLKPSLRINQLEFITKHGIPGKVVIDTPNTTFGNKYKVRAYPTAFLIDSNHKVIYAPAKNPLDGFEFQLENIKRVNLQVK